MVYRKRSRNRRQSVVLQKNIELIESSVTQQGDLSISSLDRNMSILCLQLLREVFACLRRWLFLLEPIPGKDGKTFPTLSSLLLLPGKLSFLLHPHSSKSCSGSPSPPRTQMPLTGSERERREQIRLLLPAPLIETTLGRFCHLSFLMAEMRTNDL